MFKSMSKLLNGNIRVEDGIRFPLVVSKVVMTEKDRLHVGSEELKPKIMKLLETRKAIHISELLELIDADIFEIKFALNELKKEGKIAFG